MEVGAQAAATPHGRLTVAFSDAAARQGAYKLLEKGHAPPQAVVASAAQAAWGRARGDFVFVPIDGSTLSLVQASLDKGFGPIGTQAKRAYGAESMNAVAVSPAGGVPLGVVGHCTWVRPATPRPPGTRTECLPVEEKETRHWLDVGQQVVEGWRASGFAGVPWLKLDAGSDAREVLEWLVWSTEGALFTLRAAQDRLCAWPAEGCMSEVVEGLAPRGHYKLKVPPSEKRTARTARIAVRFTEVVVKLTCPRTDRVLPVALFLVHAREEGTCPRGEEPVEWMLLTNHPVHSFKAARLVIRGYSMRWRVEEVHRSWKSGCHVEKSAMTYGPFSTWAALLLCVAVRIERLKRLSRETPNVPADTEFSPHELSALLLLKRKGQQYKTHYVPPLGEAVLWLAELGGYTGNSSGGPPGATTLKRGLDKLEIAAEALRFQQELSKSD